MAHSTCLGGSPTKTGAVVSATVSECSTAAVFCPSFQDTSHAAEQTTLDDTSRCQTKAFCWLNVLLFPKNRLLSLVTYL